MLIIYLTLMSVTYSLPAAQAVILGPRVSDAQGELIAVAFNLAGLLLAARRPLSGWRYAAALTCVGVAPSVALLFHDQIAAQVWSVVPLMFVAIFIRTWHSARTTRIAVAALTGTAAVALLVAPAPIPLLWVAFYAVSVLGAAEVFGLCNSVLLDAALRDPLTLVWNRAGISHHADRLITRARRRRQHVAVVVFDVDDFKGVNDQRGHAVGDLMLSELTRHWVARIPPSAVLGRIGGDEFVLILGGHDITRARALADELTDGLSVGVTYGVAAGRPDRNAGLDTLFAAADHDLYERKRARKR